MEQNNWQWLEKLLESNFPKIKILNRAVINYNYTLQVKINDEVKIISIERKLIDDRLKQQILSIVNKILF